MVTISHSYLYKELKINRIEDNGLIYFSSNQICSNLWTGQYPFTPYRVQIFVRLSGDCSHNAIISDSHFLSPVKSSIKKLNRGYFFRRANIVLFARLKATLVDAFHHVSLRVVVIFTVPFPRPFSPPRLIIDKLNWERVSSNRLQGFGLIFRLPLICTLGRSPPICIRLDPKHNSDPLEMLD